MVKVALFAAMVGLALINRFRLVPSLRRRRECGRAAARAVSLGRRRAGTGLGDPRGCGGARHLGTRDPPDLEDAMTECSLSGLQPVVSFCPINQNGNQPARDEYTDDGEAKIREIVI